MNKHSSVLILLCIVVLCSGLTCAAAASEECVAGTNMDGRHNETYPWIFAPEVDECEENLHVQRAYYAAMRKQYLTDSVINILNIRGKRNKKYFWILDPAPRAPESKKNLYLRLAHNARASQKMCEIVLNEKSFALAIKETEKKTELSVGSCADKQLVEKIEEIKRECQAVAWVHSFLFRNEVPSEKQRRKLMANVNAKFERMHRQCHD